MDMARQPWLGAYSTGPSLQAADAHIVSCWFPATAGTHLGDSGCHERRAHRGGGTSGGLQRRAVLRKKKNS